jgi:thiol-disulfide isomerase/thioredoxin
MYKADWKKYFIVFLITLGIFATAFYASTRLNDKKLQEIQTIQNRVSIDILSSETQFTLLSESSCETVGDSSLSKDLDSLGAKLSYAEESINSNQEDIVWLKKNYALLEIKDYVLMKKLAQKCEVKPVYVLYFYSNKEGSCVDCEKEGIVLTELRRKYPGLRVYSFDYDLDLPAQKTLLTLYKVKDTLPALVINNKVEYGFKSVEDIEKSLPELKYLTEDGLATTTTETKAVKKK